MIEEEWKIIDDFPNYKASNFGEIIRFKSDMKQRRPSGSPLKKGFSSTGYHQVCLMKNLCKTTIRVNRLVCEVFHGKPPTRKHHAAHLDGNKLNNSASNLRWATAKENEFDKRLHGTARIGDKHWSKLQPEKRARGIGHGLAKLTDDDVRKIRMETRKQRDIAKDYGVTQRVIWSIKANRTWTHVV